MIASSPLLGSVEPRLWTRPARPLNRSTSLGFACIEFATDVLEIELFPWQRWFLIHALELNADGNLRFRTVTVLVSRQNGKTVISKVLALFAMYVLGSKLVLGSAQSLDIAESSWSDTVDMAESVPDLKSEIEAIVRGNGRRSFDLAGGQKYKVTAASRRAGRGLSVDLALLDELREHVSFEAWGAISKTTLARPSALILGLSSAGDDRSIVLRHLRMSALTQMASDGDPEAMSELERWAKVVHHTPEGIDPDDETTIDLDAADESSALFEWSAPAGSDPRDRKAWALANPALGVGITERALSSAQKIDPPWVFNSECMGIWASSSGNGPFPPGAWTEGTDNASEIAPHSPITVCVELSWDRTMAHIVAAGYRPDGDLHCEVIASRAGTEWLKPYLLERHARHQFAAVTCQEKGAPVSSLVGELSDGKLPYIPWSGPDLTKAGGSFFDLVRLPVAGEIKKRIFHTKQPLLDVSATSAATKPSGDAWLIDRKHSPGDASPISGAIGAVWALENIPARPRVSAYESRRLVMV